MLARRNRGPPRESAFLHLVTSIVLCQQERGGDPLRFVFMDEDGEEDAVHGSDVLKVPMGLCVGGLRGSGARWALVVRTALRSANVL
jgi:hypothetical protein